MRGCFGPVCDVDLDVELETRKSNRAGSIVRLLVNTRADPIQQAEVQPDDVTNHGGTTPTPLMGSSHALTSDRRIVRS
jgi:hypothetical protein